MGDQNNPVVEYCKVCGIEVTKYEIDNQDGLCDDCYDLSDEMGVITSRDSIPKVTHHYEYDSYEELHDALAQFEQMGYMWSGGDKPTQWKPDYHPTSIEIQLWDDMEITFNGRNGW